MYRLSTLLIGCVLSTAVASQAIVMPSARVVNGVNIRASASTSSETVGLLMPGEQAASLGEVPRWNRIEYTVHGTGFVSKAWTRVIIDSLRSTAASFDVYFVDVGTGLAVFARGGDFSLIYNAGSNDGGGGGRASPSEPPEIGSVEDAAQHPFAVARDFTWMGPY